MTYKKLMLVYLSVCLAMAIILGCASLHFGVAPKSWGILGIACFGAFILTNIFWYFVKDEIGNAKAKNVHE